MRVVIDTNALIGAFISAKGAPAQIFDLWLAGALEIVTSQAAIDELQRVLLYPRVRSRLRYSDDQVQQFLLLLRQTSSHILGLRRMSNTIPFGR